MHSWKDCALKIWIKFKNSSQMGFALPFQQLLHPCTFRKSCMNFLTFGVCCYMSQGKWLVYLFTWHMLSLFFSFAFQHKANLFRRVYNKDRSGVANVFSVIHMVWEGTRVVHLIWALFPSLRGEKNLACGRKMDNYKSFQTRLAGFEMCCRH